MTYPEGVLPPLLRSTSFRRVLVSAGLAACATSAWAATPITGTVINKTTGKPAGGDQVVLIQLQQGMQEATRTTTDARGRFTLEVPDEGIHLVRVTHQKAAYFQPVQPDQHTVAVTVYDAAASVPGVSTGVEELHIEATPTELHVVEVLQVLNVSTPPRTQFGPDGFQFYLPKGALVGRTGAITQGGMPVQTPAIPRSEPGHYSFLFPLRPGETQFGIAYTLPYTGSYTFTPRLDYPVKTFAVILPTGMKVTPANGSLLARQPGKPGTQDLLAQDVPAGQGPEFSVSGTGSMPETPSTAGNGAGPNASTANPGSNQALTPGGNAGPMSAATSDAAAPAVSNSELAGGRGLNNPLDESGERDPWAKYKWWILSGLALLLAAAAGFLLRKPTVPTPPNDGNILPPNRDFTVQPGQPHHQAVLSVLKEELFLLETERLQGTLPENEYRTCKSALETTLGRVLQRHAGSIPVVSQSTASTLPDPLPASPQTEDELASPGTRPA